MTLILASQSPRRRDLLGRLNIPFEVVASDLDERSPLVGEDPVQYSVLLARHKAQQVAQQRPEALVIGADTVVAVDVTILGKPATDDDAVRMLGLLRGRAHLVVTGMALQRGTQVISSNVASPVRMRTYSDEEMRRYVATGEPFDKAGSYAVQGLGGRLVERVEGCYLAVVGLPLCRLVEMLVRMGQPTTQHIWCSFCSQRFPRHDAV